jgi:DNA (cytosine-5)-methyltransferase 1
MMPVGPLARAPQSAYRAPDRAPSSSDLGVRWPIHCGGPLPPALSVASATVEAYRFIDLFAGCGGMTRGFVDSGRFTPIFAVDSDPDAAETYALNFGDEHLEPFPIQEVENFPGADVVIGGPPCQGFSPLNRERHGVESRRLWEQYLRALDAAEPVVFVMENVPLLLKSKEYARFKRAVEEREFLVEERVLDLADYGVPQRRRRAIAIGTRLPQVPWPIETHRDPETLDDGRPRWLTFAEAVKGLPRKPDGKRWHRDRKPWPETIRRYEAVPPDGGNRFQMEEELDRAGAGHLVPPCWRNHRTGSYDVFGRLWWNRPATTIRTEFYKPEKGRYLHPFEHRAITVREAARLMSFPDDHLLPEHQSMTAIARQIGNAVPPLLALRVAETIARALDSHARSRNLRAAA